MLVTESFRRVLSLLAPYQTDAILPSPATESALLELQGYFGGAVPATLVAVYRVHDGSPTVHGDRLAENLFYSYRFVSVSKALSLAKSMEQVRQCTPYPRDPIPAIPTDTVQDLLSSSGWLPFAEDGAGGYLAIDNAPGPSGVPGQVINFGRDDSAHFQLAASFEAFLERVVCDYEEKRLHHFFGDNIMLIDRLLQARA